MSATLPWIPASRCAFGLLTTACSVGFGAPVSEPWPFASSADAAAVAAASLSGWHATSSTLADAVEVRDAQGGLVRGISAANIVALAPWMQLDASGDGPSAMAFSDSGRLLFIAVHDAASAPDGQANDVILRYDTQTDTLGLFARVSIASTDDLPDPPSLVHFRGQLHVGLNGQVATYRAQRNDAMGVLQFSSPIAGGAMVTALAVDRAQGGLIAGTRSLVARASLGAGPFTFSTLGAASGLRALAFSESYGLAGAGVGSTPGGESLLLLSDAGGSSAIAWASAAQVRGQQAFAPAGYTVLASSAMDMAATSDGRLLLAQRGATSPALALRESLDARLSYQAWLRDEFGQVLRLARALITANPSGWVRDADVQQGWTRFHPATPDAAAWTILLLLVNDAIMPGGDPSAATQIRAILDRYAGLSPDGIRPLRSADGIYWHWLDLASGNAAPGWGDTYSTMSTMKIVLAADRAAARFPTDVNIQRARRAIVCGVRNWDAYFNPGTRQMYLQALAGGGPNLSTPSGPYHEGLILAEQAAAFGGSAGDSAYARWLDRASSPSATFVSSRPVTGDIASVFQPAFISLYSLLLQPDFRASTSWREQIRNLRLSNAAWTDDNGPQYATVFSAGTTKDVWGGYHADSLSDHPGDVTTFPSLMAFAAGDGVVAGSPSDRPRAGSGVAEAHGAYNAFRRGARQTFLSGASVLYRRSNVDRAYAPNSAGLPDLVLGALGLAEQIQPGVLAAVVARPYLSCRCPADFNSDGVVDFFDYLDFAGAYSSEQAAADFNTDGVVDFFDYLDFADAFATPCES
ncbi:MAG: hypothetical protein SFZ23_00835 [Planctomycetota bacterium]|nr:hypothetical protein [Planctomycetota bacterium]